MDGAAVAGVGVLLLISYYAYVYFIKTATAGSPPKPPVAAGGWPLIGHLNLLGGSGLPYEALGAVADKYGPIFSINIGVHPAVVVSSWELAKECFTTHDVIVSSRPKYTAAKILQYNYASFAFAPYGDFWRDMHKIVVSDLLSTRRLELLRGIRDSEVKNSLGELYRAWMEKRGGSRELLVEMKQWLGDMNLNVILRMIAGKRYCIESAEEEERARRVWRVLREFIRFLGLLVVGDAIPALGWLDLGGEVKQMKKTAIELDSITSEWLEEHRQRRDSGETKTEQDFIDVLMSTLHGVDLAGYQLDTVIKATCSESVGPKSYAKVVECGKISKAQIVCQSREIEHDFVVEFAKVVELDTTCKSCWFLQSRDNAHDFLLQIIHDFKKKALIAAGTDTTTITMTWALSLLLNNRHALKKVQDELDEHVGKERVVDESDINKLVYLQAVVKETLRLYAAAPLSGPREFTENCTLGGYHIQAGTRLIFNIWKLHRDPRVWSNPLEFQPERFLTTHKHVDVKGQHFELLPFSGGRRSCPGIPFALQMTHLALATFLQAFEVTTPSNAKVDMSATYGLTVIKTTPLEVLVEPRLPYQLLFTNEIKKSPPQ